MRKWFKRIVVSLIVLALIGAGIHFYWKNEAEKTAYPPVKFGAISTVYGADGTTVLGTISSAGNGYVPLTDEEVSPLLRQAHMAAEDRGFYTHGAISPLGIARAAWTNFKQGAIAAGGSTVTQQTVKNTYLTQDQTYERKLQEVKLAYKLESDFTKDQILTKYVNSNFYGLGYGVEAGSMAWFGHSAREINNIANPEHVAKAAFLAALVQSPGLFAKKDAAGKFTNWQALIERQHYVLDGLRLVENLSESSKVPQSVINAAKQIRLRIVGTPSPAGRVSSADPYVLAYVKEWLIAWQAELAKQSQQLTEEEAQKAGQSTAESMLARGGLSIYTSIRPDLQQLLKQSVEIQLPRNGSSAGAVILDPRTGSVVAMYGGSNYAVDPFNDALYAERPVGSTMKAVLLTDVVANGISVKSVLPAPASITLPGQPPIWNHDRTAAPGCTLTIEDALAHSNNPVSIELITGQMAATRCKPEPLTPVASRYPVSPKTVAALARKMGADDSLVPNRTSPSKLDEVPTLALGVSSMTPLKMASIGATLANNGVHNKPHLVVKISDAASGTNVFVNQPVTERVIDEDAAATVNQTLKGVYTKGTAQKAQVPGQVLAGKTGTTDTDAWMLAWSPTTGKGPSYVCSVWTGFADYRPSATSSLSTAKVCQQYLRGALGGQPSADFPKANLNLGDIIGVR